MDFSKEIITEGEFEYVEKGEGHTIIVLHGLFGALSNFADLIDEFSTRFKVVVPLMPLYSMPIAITSVRSLSKFVSKFIAHKGYKNYTILGNSLGGHVGLVNYLKHPEDVHSLVLTGSSGLYENAFGGSFPRREDKNYIREKIAVTFYDSSLVTDDLVEEVYEIVRNRSKLIKVLALAKSAIRHNLSKELGNITVPTCLIWGKNDTITPPHVAEDFNKLIPDSNLYWIDKCGHAPMMERPEIFNKILSDWFKERFSL